MSISELIKQKCEIESRITELGLILKEEGDVGMSGNIIDSEGYPRNDVDIYKIRLTRQEINCLQNDYKEIIQKIDEEGISLNKENTETISKYQTNEPIQTFLKITQVDNESPSLTAGLEKGDEIIQFGPFTGSSSSKNLSEISEHVKEREDKIVLLKVSRKHDGSKHDEILRLKLVPKKWKGHGLLGCKLNYI